MGGVGVDTRQSAVSYLVARHVDGNHPWKTEIPLKIGHDKRGDESTAGSVDVNRRLESLLTEQVVDGLHVLILASIGSTQNAADADGVLVNQVDSLLGVDDVAVRGAVDELLIDLEVAGSLLPTDLDSRRHDDVRMFVGLALGYPLVLPAALHGQDGEHDGLGATHTRGADGTDFVAFGHGGVKEAADHGHTSVLDVCRLGILLIVNEVLGEGLCHQLLSLLFLHVVSTIMFTQG